MIRHFTRHWEVRNLGENLDVQQVSQEACESFVHSNAHGGVFSIGSCATQEMDVVLGGLDDIPAWRLLGLSLMAFGEGTLDGEELILQ